PPCRSACDGSAPPPRMRSSSSSGRRTRTRSTRASPGSKGSPVEPAARSSATWRRSSPGAFPWARTLEPRSWPRRRPSSRRRGRAMAELAEGGGAMASSAAPRDLVEPFLRAEEDVVVAGLNGPRQTVVSGPAAGVGSVLRRAEAAGLGGTRLPVSHAFHSRLVAPAAAALDEYLAAVSLRPLERRVASTITGGLLAS